MKIVTLTTAPVDVNEPLEYGYIEEAAETYEEARAAALARVPEGRRSIVTRVRDE